MKKRWGFKNWFSMAFFVAILTVVVSQVGFSQDFERESDFEEDAYSVEEQVDETALSTTADVVSLDSEDTQSTEPGNVTLDFKDADILLVLRLLSLKSGVNIVAGPEVEGTVTIRLHDVPWEKALDVVLRTYGYVYERDGDGKIVRVTTRDNLAAEELVTETFVLNYSTAVEIEEAIKEIISERGRIKSVQRTNTVIVTDIATNIYKIGEIIRRLDKRTPQVYIDSTIIETSQQNTRKLGVAWGTQVSATSSSRQFSFPWKSNDSESSRSRFFPEDISGTTGLTGTVGTLDFSQFNATVNFLESFSDTKTLSNPRIVTLSNQSAKVQVGSEIPIPNWERNENTGGMVVTGYDTREIGVVLNVTPHVNDANEILVDLSPEISSQGANQSFGADFVAPTFNVTIAKTQLLINDGETIAIGGLVKEIETENRTKVPFLGDIPVLGRLFRSETKNEGADDNRKETLFFVTCTIVDTSGQPEFSEL